MTEQDIKSNWYYFRSLANQLQQTEQYVDHALDNSGQMLNGKAFSNEFAKIIMLAASEFEVTAKTLCKESGVTVSWNANIVTLSKVILKEYPQIIETMVYTPYKTIKPLADWKVIKQTNRNGKKEDKVVGIDWWEKHNNIKHDRVDDFINANLENSIYTMSSLLVIELYLSQKVLGNVDAISEIGCCYFDLDYGVDNLVVSTGTVLPDFK